MTARVDSCIFRGFLRNVKSIFLVANVLFTAAYNPRGKAAFLIALGNGGMFKLATSAYAREEALRNHERKFPDVLPEFTRLVASICIVPENLSLPCPERLAEKDRPIFPPVSGKMSPL
jgi:uncharacterized protein